MVSEKDYNQLSDKVYDVENGKSEELIEQGDEILKKSYQVLATEDNPSNGMQAMAVAPIVNGKPDTSQIVIAYAGRTPVI